MDSLNDLIETFDNLLVDLNGEWRLHQELFQVPEHYVLFAASSPMIWHMLRDASIDSVFMSIARLLDPATSCGKDNLSVARILLNMTPGVERDQTQRQYDELVGLYDSALRHWRNRKLSHNDLNTIKGMSPLPTISYTEISELIDKINELGRRIGHIVQEVDKNFKPYISNQDWVWQLIETLKKGIESRATTKRDSSGKE